MKLTKKNKVIIYIILVILSIIWLFPIVWTFMTSIKTEAEAVSWPLSILPTKPTLNNFTKILTDKQAPVYLWFGNSLINATIHTILSVLISAMAAYGFAKFEFKYRDQLFFVMLGTMMIPSILNLVPLYSIVNKLGWIDTRWALIIPGLANVFGTFLLRGFFMSVPLELEESARIDGADHWTIFTKIMLPLVRPGLVVLGLFSFLGNWNDYMWPLTVINSNSNRTITIGLSVIKGTYNVLPAKMMALTSLSIIPVIILFLFARKYLLEGSNIATGIK